MTNEERIDWLCRLRTDLNNGIIYTPWNKEFTEALTEILEPQPSEDCRNCKKWDECPCGKEGHANGTSIGYSIGECKDYEPSVTPQQKIDEIIKRIEETRDKDKIAEYPYNRCIKIVKDVLEND